MSNVSPARADLRVGALRAVAILGLVISACSHAVDTPTEATSNVSEALPADGCAETTGANLVQPQLTCSGTDSVGSFAVFGYSNPTGHVVSVPEGTLNSLTAGGTGAGSHQSPPTLFDAISRTDAFVVRYTGASPTWTLNGHTAQFPNLGTPPSCATVVDPATGVERVTLGTGASASTVGVANLDPATLLNPAQAAVATQTPMAGGTRAIGTMLGSLRVGNDATPTYEIPLWVSPGRAGIQPDLALTYANGGNGIVGAGWVLRGLSSIALCTSTYSTGSWQYPNGQDPDGALCLDGAPLARIGANEWRPEGAPNTQVLAAQRGASNNILVFTINLPTGISQTYGGAPNSTIAAGPNTGRWSVVKTQDRFGNAVAYDYELAPARTGWATGTEPRIHQIRYTLVRSDEHHRRERADAYPRAGADRKPRPLCWNGKRSPRRGGPRREYSSRRRDVHGRGVVGVRDACRQHSSVCDS
ncbi:MAG: SpvB/TcaC N-terminal domain-containing protein [Polyangiales bacterium]